MANDMQLREFSRYTFEELIDKIYELKESENDSICIIDELREEIEKLKETIEELENKNY